MPMKNRTYPQAARHRLHAYRATVAAARAAAIAAASESKSSNKSKSKSHE